MLVDISYHNMYEHVYTYIYVSAGKWSRLLARVPAAGRQCAQRARVGNDRDDMHLEVASGHAMAGNHIFGTSMGTARTCKC